MCLIFVAWRAHPQVKLLVAANRDEYHDRPTAPAQWWPHSDPEIFAGRDLKAGGTWLGLTRTGRFAALTNYRDAGRGVIEGPSRGALVHRLLGASSAVGPLLGELEANAVHYNAFSVLFSDGQDLAIFESVPGRGRVLPPGRYALSNHLLDTPWPKVQALRTRMMSPAGEFPDKPTALALLRDTEPAPDETLPRTGLPLERERRISSIFVQDAAYGTRCSTLVRIDAQGGVEFDEWSWDRDARLVGHVETTFRLECSMAQR